MFGIREVVREGINIPITDRERTFLDCIRRPEYCGGLEEVLKSVSTFHKLDYGLLEEYLELFGEQSLRQKTGYILSLMENELTVPDGFLQRLRRTVKNKTYYLVPHHKENSGKYVKEWNIIVPKNIEEVLRFA